MYSGQADPAPTKYGLRGCIQGNHKGCPYRKTYIINQTSYIITHNSKTMNNIWGKILKIVITVLTAIATTFGLQACI